MSYRFHFLLPFPPAIGLLEVITRVNHRHIWVNTHTDDELVMYVSNAFSILNFRFMIDSSLCLWMYLCLYVHVTLFIWHHLFYQKLIQVFRTRTPHFNSFPEMHARSLKGAMVNGNFKGSIEHLRIPAFLSSPRIYTWTDMLLLDVNILNSNRITCGRMQIV